MSKNYTKKTVMAAALIVGVAGANTAASFDIVFDPANFGANMASAIANNASAVSNGITAGSNIAIAAETIISRKKLEDINHSLTDAGEGTMLHYTTNIDNSTKSIDESTTRIETVSNLNYQIDSSFSWVTNNYYNGGEIPIPTEAEDNFAKMIDSGSVGQYMANAQDAGSYQDTVADAKNLSNVGIEASAKQKLANDALVMSLSSTRKALKEQAHGVQGLINNSLHQQGHGNQLQYANALAGAQAVQLLEMRGTMLAAENARAAAAQAAADTEARQIASRDSLRAGLSSPGVVSVASSVQY